MTAEQATRKFDVHPRTIAAWASRGLIPGAEKVMHSPSYGVWQIPDDAERPRLHAGGRRRKGVSKPPAPAKPLTHAQKLAYIRDHAHTKTYAQIREYTGMTTSEIRSAYDRMHERYGI